MAPDDQGQQATADRTQESDQQYPSFNFQGQDFDFNQAFASQMASSLPGGGQTLIAQILPALFDEFERNNRAQREAVEHSLRTLRQTSATWAQQMILQQSQQAIVQAVVPVVCRAVVEQIKRDPQWREYLRQQVEQYSSTSKK